MSHFRLTLWFKSETKPDKSKANLLNLYLKMNLKFTKLDPKKDEIFESVALERDHLVIEGMNGARVYGLTSSM